MILVFDLSGVFFNDGLEVAVERISKRFNKEPKNVEFVLNGSLAEKYRTGLEREKEFWERAKEHLGITDINAVRDIFFSAYYPHQESIDLMKQLRTRGIRIGYLSNSPEDRTAHLEKKYHFITLFDFGLFSYEAHVWKPNPRIYQALVEKYALNPLDILYVDDRESNLRPAQALGMKTFLWESVSQFRSATGQFGIHL